MRYRVTIDGREREVDVTIAPGGAIAVMLDGAKVDAEVRPVPGGVSLRVGTRVHDVMVASAGGDDVQLAAGAARAVAQVLSERARAERTRSGKGGGPSAKELRAPMPGRVVRVLCKAGDAVSAGQPVVVVEAMKMENELRASGDATVAQVHVTEGASVEGRALLVTFA
jgi:biotin carboxyl carrier protein